MYLTCATIDRLHPSARQALGDCCDMHRNVMKLFASAQATRENGQILYRVLEEAGQPRLYITSLTKPDLSQAAWLQYGQDMRQRDLSPLLNGFEAGTTLRFDLLAHPSKKVDAGRSNSARVFLKTQEERHAWLERQGEKNGFSLCACHEDVPYDVLGKRKTGLLQLRAVRFDGVLRVTDAAAFRKGYACGIGPEKAYGLGMLMLKRG